MPSKIEWPFDYIGRTGVWPDDFVGRKDLKPLFYWVPNQSLKRTRWEDFPEEVFVAASERADAGCIIFSKYRNEWMANSGSHRALVLYLLKQLEGKDAEQASDA